MTKATVAEWDATAANNTDINDISLAENVMKPPAVNNAFREMMAQIAAYFGTEDLKWRLKPIGEIVYVNTGLPGVEIPPADAGFIELTAGLDGAGEYNEGKLTSETITGSGATLVATAVIDDAESPMDGATISLINTEERVTYAGERSKAGDVFNDQMQQITGTFARSTSRVGTGNPGTLSGAFSYGGSGQVGFMTSAVNSGSDFTLDFDSADSPDARAGDRTRAKGQFLVAFLKYKDVA